jgi:hypothetical protein
MPEITDSQPELPRLLDHLPSASALQVFRGEQPFRQLAFGEGEILREQLYVVGLADTAL